MTAGMLWDQLTLTIAIWLPDNCGQLPQPTQKTEPQPYLRFSDNIKNLYCSKLGARQKLNV